MDSFYENEAWEQIGNKCLSCAIDLLESDTTTTAETAVTVRTLVETAVAIGALNLRLAEQSRFFSSAFLGPPSLQSKAGN